MRRPPASRPSSTRPAPPSPAPPKANRSPRCRRRSPKTSVLAPMKPPKRPAVKVSFIRRRHSGARVSASPESITTVGSMDSGPAPSGASRNDDARGDYSVTILSPTGFLRINTSDLEYRMIGPSPADAPTIVMLHEGLGSAALWGDFPEKLAAATGAGVFVYSRAG